jgi:hypothetical protein
MGLVMCTHQLHYWPRNQTPWLKMQINIAFFLALLHTRLQHLIKALCLWNQPGRQGDDHQFERKSDIKISFAAATPYAASATAPS